MVSSDNPFFGNLKNNFRNPNASSANLRTGRLTSPSLTLGTSAKRGGLAFEAMMAVNESQNQVIGEVLKGPVSQQTQRQLAQLKTLSSQDPKLNQLAKTGRALGQENGQSLPARGQADLTSLKSGAAAILETDAPLSESDPRYNALSRGSRIFGNLTGGRTLKKGVDAGKIFTPSQLSSYRKKNGLNLVLQRPTATESLSVSAKVAAITEKEAGGANPYNGAMSQKAVAMARAALNPQSVTRTKEEEATETPKAPASQAAVEGLIAKVATALGLDSALIKAVVKTESNFNQKAVSKAGAKGLMQLMPATAKEMGVNDPFNPLENIWGGARYLKRMLDRHGGDLNTALAAYNWGPGNVDRHGDSRLPKETRRYIEAVNRNYARFKKESLVA
ncbi:MAG: lytic transglycosylase domain-containing protein [Deltaproteobacteria bacterium]|jgi:soluble lytic murein transglycosylase-like protein|nr:lytic transglycosylase domain-containing protein [Deltaproteobacteria bacterium]